MSQKNEAVKNIVAGSVAGIAEAIATWPSENIKTQMVDDKVLADQRKARE